MRHPKLQKSSAEVRLLCDEICMMLEQEGLRAAGALRRDGFIYEGESGWSLRIDPKVETLRIWVGRDPFPPVPRELVHQGKQPDWIVVEPKTKSIALAFLRSLAEHMQRNVSSKLEP